MNIRRNDLWAAIAVAVAFVLIRFGTGILAPLGALIVLITVVVVLVVNLNRPLTAQEEVDYVTDPPFVRALLNTTRFAALWLAIRLFVGLQWLESGLGKIGNPAWMETGEALQGYWERAVAIPEVGRPAITYDWYRGFLQGMLDAGAYTWFAKLIAVGETLVGLALIIGIFVGIAAFFGAFMNFNFLLAGSASTNPVLFLLALLLMAAWKVAGYYGIDRWLLPALGAPWRPGPVFRSDSPQADREREHSGQT